MKRCIFTSLLLLVLILTGCVAVDPPRPRTFYKYYIYNTFTDSCYVCLQTYENTHLSETIYGHCNVEALQKVDLPPQTETYIPYFNSDGNLMEAPIEQYFKSMSFVTKNKEMIKTINLTDENVWEIEETIVKDTISKGKFAYHYLMKYSLQ